MRQLNFLLLSLTMWFLNVLDAVVTLKGLATGRVREANPLMEWIIERSPVAFVVVKITLITICLIALWRQRNNIFVHLALVCCVLLYTGIVLWGVNLLGMAGL